MRVCAFIYLSNHCHLLLYPTDGKQLADFMRYVNSKIAREVCRLHDWGEKVWGRRYVGIRVSDTRVDQVRRLRYLLSQGCKEGLVASPRHWPGATSTRALMQDEEVEGVWIDRTSQYRAKGGRGAGPEARFTTRHRLKLTPLPCWEGTPDAEWRAEVRRLVKEIEDEAPRKVLGRRAILRQHPHDRPKGPASWRPAPRFHAIEREVRQSLENAYRLAVIAYREAREELLEGREARFPCGCFPPALSFVRMQV